MCCGGDGGETVTHLEVVAGASCLIDLRQDGILLGELEVENNLRRAPRGASRVCAGESRSVSFCRHYLGRCTIEKRGKAVNKVSNLFFHSNVRPGQHRLHLLRPITSQHGEGPVSARAGAQTHTVFRSTYERTLCRASRCSPS